MSNTTALLFGFMAKTEQIRIVVNGEPCAVPADATVASVLAELKIDAARVAVEMNRGIIRKEDWDREPVPDGAVFEIVQFVGGG